MDNTILEVGEAICKAHEAVQAFPKDWERKLDELSEVFKSWLHHPLGRNWNLIAQIESIISEDK